MESKVREMAMVAKKVRMHHHDQALEDLEFWLKKSPKERVAAVTFLVNQTLMPGQRMDKTKFNKIDLNK